MNEMQLGNFEDFLNKNNVKIVKELNQPNEKLDKVLLNEHINNIVKFHVKSKGYKNYITSKIENKLGRQIEKYKLDLKRCNKFIISIKHKDQISEIDKYILNCIPQYLDRGQICIKNIFDNNYLELIKRSMRNDEICLNKVYFNNIISNQKSIEVVDISQCEYNMVEMDLVYFLYKIKKKKLNLDIKQVINLFCELENLNKYSFEFIYNMAKFPYYTLKLCNKYAKESKDMSEKEYIKKFNKCIKYDNAFM